MEDVHTMLHAWIQWLPLVQDEKHIHHRYLDNLVRVWLISKLYMDPLNFGALEQKETLTQKRVLLSRSTDKNICVTAAAARDLSVWMTCPKLTSTHPQICLTGKHSKNINTL